MGDEEREQHKHGRGAGLYLHTHAFARHPHAHMLRAICQRPECEGCVTHNIHRGPEPTDAPPSREGS